VDGTHCPIQEPTVPDHKIDKTNWSLKTNNAAVNYEVVIAVYHNRVVWINGPFPAAKHGITIYRSALVKKIPTGSVAVADRGYKGEPTTISTDVTDNDDTKKFKSRVRSRHETFNWSIEDLSVLICTFLAWCEESQGRF
jgi:DDE superfamily endonuclease